MGNIILLADKSITIQKIVQLTFADDNFNIHTVSDGQAALEIIPKIRPDLILADISLPVKSGYELCTSIRNDPEFSDSSSVPVILLAGIYETMDEERSRLVEERVKQAGANDFLSKPFDPQLLISKVKQYLSSSGANNSSPLAGAPVFAQEPDGGINLFETESPVKPPDDTEKTMMLPGGPFGTMFASEPAPYEEEPKQTRRDPQEIEAIKPVNEVIFDEDSFPAVELGSQQEDDNLFSQATLKIEQRPNEDGRFSGREEQEFEYRSGPVLEPPSISAPQEPAGSIPLILPNAEDPFADVFQEPQTVQWSSTPVSEEDSPFGVPEPPPPPPAVEEELVPSIEINEEPALFEEKDSAAPVEAFDDTWPGVPVRSNMTPAVEELFESEPHLGPLQEDAEELEPDLSDDSALEEEQAVAVETPAVQKFEPVTAAVSDELIDKIAERVLNKLSERIVSEIVWQVVPDLAEKMIRRELEKLHAAEE